MTSIRRFMVIVLLAAITLLNFLAALHGYRASMTKSQDLFDRTLFNYAQLLISSGIEGSVSSETPDDGNITFQLWSNDNKLLQRSSSMPSEKFVPLNEGYSYANFNGYRWRTFAQRHPSKPYWVIVSERNDIRYALAEEVVLASLIPIIAELPIIALFIWLIIGWGLKPVSRLAAELGNKGSDDLTPLSVTNTPKELTEVTESSNQLLNRLNDSFEREKRFSADAAHELRTPISALKIHLYNLQNIPQEESNSLHLLNISVDRMSHVIEQMLALYRTDSSRYGNDFKRFDLHKLVQQIVADQYHLFERKNQSIELDGYSCIIIADQFALEVLVKNLLDNANKYTPENGSINVNIVSSGMNVDIIVEDSGVGIPPNLYGRVFERFYRIQAGQAAPINIGCGLGFSIVQHIVKLHKGSITLGSSCNSSGLKVTVTIPTNQGLYNEA